MLTKHLLNTIKTVLATLFNIAVLCLLGGGIIFALLHFAKFILSLFSK